MEKKKNTNLLPKSKPLDKFSKAYGKYKFKIPNLTLIQRVMDYNGLSPDLKQSILPLNPDNLNQNEYENHTLLYSHIPIPTSSDWLYQHKETGQSFKIYSTGMINQPSKLHDTIFLNILDNNEEVFNQELINNTIILIEAYYPGIKVSLMDKNHSFEDLKVHSRQNGEYLQYNASQTVDALGKIIPKKRGLLVVGMTSYDIYPREDWNFVYGLANKMEGAGVFSFRRYIDHIAYKIKDREKLNIMIFKLVSMVMIHEIGHLFGLAHCIYYDCKMNGSNHLEESFSRSLFLCPVCLRKIHFNLRFDIKKRYEGLKEALSILNSRFEIYTKEIEWLEARIKLIQ